MANGVVFQDRFYCTYLCQHYNIIKKKCPWTSTVTTRFQNCLTPPPYLPLGICYLTHGSLRVTADGRGETVTHIEDDILVGRICHMPVGAVPSLDQAARMKKR